ncbi:uncharacterized protein N7482_003450 [Penicillium canariense]|uniref:AMP-activated protein kinase glycogen-binding domain-containing protein n=1 Tax=Penicillium canariense TaxID=189055 RepID=A0A9W9I4P6_9EURO|nr:uncharacterized protein N7482_003450 [Penicillium canariense]KAJ5167856.1 hypothetical protein N7482_003450 [Penicillium canariense]
MGTFTFQWPYRANEVFVTGTFDDWGKTVKLDRVGDLFAKEVALPAGEKIHYKFVVDGTWTTDSRAREESDGHNNTNNVLLPEDIIQDHSQETSTHDTTTPATMSGVTPDATTAALAAQVPREPNGDLPGTFPETPAQESEPSLSVAPIPASGGYGNPIKLNPGEKVPDPSSIHGNTVQSTVKLDKESYEKGDSVPLGSAGTQSDTAGSSTFTVPPVSKNLIPESSLPIGGPAQQAAMADPGYTIQSAAPTSTTAALAAQVPLEKDKQTNGTEPAQEVPQVVKDSIAEADQTPEAAAYTEAVEEKREMENELHAKVPVEESAGTPAPTTAAATQPTAPGGGLVVPLIDSSDVSPTSTPPPRRVAPTSAPPTSEPAPTSAPAPTSEPAPTESQAAPTVTTGVATSQTAEKSTPEKPTPEKSTPKQAANTAGTGDLHAKEEKKKKRISGFFSRLKEKLK